MKRILKKRTACIVALLLLFGIGYILFSPREKTVDKLTSENVESLTDGFEPGKCKLAKGVCYANPFAVTIGVLDVDMSKVIHLEP